MKKLRAIMCILLAVTMILVFCACEKKEQTEEDTSTQTAETSEPTQNTETTEPTQSTETTAPSETTQTDDPADDQVSEAGLILTSQSDYENRPREIQEGTVLNYLAGADVPSQLPWNCGPEGWFWTNVYEGLLYLYMNDPTDIRGCIAETWEVSDDYMTWTFHIRDGIKFHDGTVCDADAVARSFTYYQEASPATLPNYNIESWEATDASTFVLHLNAPCPYLETGLSLVAVVSPDALDQYGINDNKAAVSTAPYYIANYTSGVNIELKANPDYYIEERMPCIETVNCQIVKDSNTVVMALVNGDLDGGLLTAVEGYYNLKDNDYDGAVIPTYDVACALWLNAKKVPKFQTFEVRKAMSRLIDWSSVNELVFDGMGQVQDGLWTAGTSGYVPFDDNYYNVDEGLELLASVGVDPTDIEFDSSIVEAWKDVFVSIQNELKKVDITMNVESIEAAANFTLLMSGDWSITIGSFGYTSNSPWSPGRIS